MYELIAVLASMELRACGAGSVGSCVGVQGSPGVPPNTVPHPRYRQRIG